jgi:hypothetical protein
VPSITWPATHVGSDASAAFRSRRSLPQWSVDLVCRPGLPREAAGTVRRWVGVDDQRS